MKIVCSPLLLVVALSVSSCATAVAQSNHAAGSPARIGGDRQIVPGRRIGNAALGMERSKAHQLFGKPQYSKAWPDKKREDTWEIYASKRERTPNLFYVLFEGGKATQIETNSPRFHTSTGLSKDSTFKRILKSHPHVSVTQLLEKGDESLSLYYDDIARGITFAIGANFEVTAQTAPHTIIVHPAGSGVAYQPNARTYRPPDLDRTGAPMAWTSKETMGKSEQQILAIGRDKWLELYASGSRETTANTADALLIYGDALSRRNWVRISQQSPKRRAALDAMQTVLVEFEKHAIEMHATLSEGGDTFRSARAAVHADVGEVIARLLGDRGPAAPHRKPADLDRALGGLKKKLEAARETSMVPKGQMYSVDYGMKQLSKAREALQEIKSRLKSFSASESDLILGACIDWLEGKLAVS